MMSNSLPCPHAAAIAALLLSLLFPAVTIADGHFFDGNDWKRFAAIMKISYVSGLYDGSAFCEVNLRRQNCGNKASIAQRFPVDMAFKDVVAALDIFYSHIDNSSVPIVYAIYIVKMQRDGASFDDIEQYKKHLLEMLGALP